MFATAARHPRAVCNPALAVDCGAVRALSAVEQILQLHPLLPAPRRAEQGAARDYEAVCKLLPGQAAEARHAAKHL